MGTFFGELYLRSTRPFLDPRVTGLEAEFICDALKLLPEERVLDLCCGHGRHLEHLLARGFRAFGLELDPVSLTEMRPSGRAFVVRGDLFHLPFRSRFPALFSWYASLYLSADDRVNREALREAAAALVPGGRMLLHSHNPLAQQREPTSHFETVLPDGTSVVEHTHFDELTGVLDGHRRRTLGDVTQEGDFRVRCPTIENHQAWCKGLGLILESAWGDINATPVSATSPDLIVLVRRP